MPKNYVFIGIFTFLLLFPTKGLLAQKGKTPLGPLLKTSISIDTCIVACDYFRVNKDNLIATSDLVFEGNVNNEDCFLDPVGFNSGCLLDYNNSSWFLIKVLSGDSLNFNFKNSQNYDIDGAIWGPILSNNIDSTCLATINTPKACDYSDLSPILNLYDVTIGEYYLLNIANFSNDTTDIYLNQPLGGEVTYSYFCPISSDLGGLASGNQWLSVDSLLSLSIKLDTASYVVAKAGNSITLLPGFESDSNAVFSAEIGICVNVSENYNPPSLGVVCEDFTNHTANSPHLYANSTANELVGTVFAVQRPEYLAYDGVYKPMSEVGYDSLNEKKFWAYREPYRYPTNVHLRTQTGCPAYPDQRFTQTKPLFRNDESVPQLDTITNYYDIDSPFFAATDLSTVFPSYMVWSMYLKDSLPNLKYRINGGSWKGNITHGNVYNEYTGQYFDITQIRGFDAPKDFYLDFTQDFGLHIDRYLVTRNSCGGHFGTTTVFNRIADSTVSVTTYQGDFLVPMKLGTINSVPNFGSSFELGSLTAGAYTYPLTSSKGNFTLDEEIYVRVRFD